MLVKHDQLAQRLAKIGTITLATLAITGAATGIINQNLAKVAELKGEVMVKVDAIKITITKINDQIIEGDKDLSSFAFRTLDAKNKIHFKADRNAKIKIVLKDKVLWQGEVEAGKPVVADVDLTGMQVGVYSLAVRAYEAGNTNYSQTFFYLDYRAAIPSIIPGGDVNAPNTGLYMTIGGRAYSMTTVATISLLTAVLIYLVATRYSKNKIDPVKANAKAKAKASRQKMDMI